MVSAPCHVTTTSINDPTSGHHHLLSTTTTTNLSSPRRSHLHHLHQQQPPVATDNVYQRRHHLHRQNGSRSLSISNRGWYVVFFLNIYSNNVYWRVGYKYGHHQHIMTMTGNSRHAGTQDVLRCPASLFSMLFFSILLMIVIRLRIQTMRLPLPPPSSSDGSGSSSNGTRDASCLEFSGMFSFL